MSTENSSHDPGHRSPGRARRRIGEDWAATITGLVLLLAALFGVIPSGLVP